MIFAFHAFVYIDASSLMASYSSFKAQLKYHQLNFQDLNVM